MPALAHRTSQDSPSRGPSPAGSPTGFDQSHGNGAVSDLLGLSGSPPAPWSDAEVGAWAFGGEDAEDCAYGPASGGPAPEPGEDPGGHVPQHLVDWVDAHLPVGLGVAVSAELGVMLGLSLSSPISGSIVNLGGGWLEVEVSGALLLGGGLGLGAVAGDSGAEAEGTCGVGPTASRVFRVPWTRLADLPTLARLAGSAILGEVFGSPVEAAMPDLAARLLGNRDLTPWLMSERLGGTGNLGVGAGAGMLGEELEASLTDTLGLDLAVDYDDLADAEGLRTGTARIEGSADLLMEVAVDLSKTLGLDTTCVLPNLHGTCALVLPFTERDGAKAFATPYVEVSAQAAVGPVGVGGAIALGPGHTGVSLNVELDPGSLLWQKVLDDTVGCALEVATLGVAELETSGSMTLGLEASLDHPELPEAASLAGDVFDWLTTGLASDSLSAHLDVVQDLVAAADLTLGVDLELLALHVDGSLEAAEGVQGGIEGDGRVALVYQRDDVLGDLSAPVTVPEAVSYVRQPYGPVAAWSNGSA